MHGPDDMPGVGRLATVADPQGAAFMVMQAAPQEGSARA
ncbi:VOC family protein [Serinicoccus sp. CUA-874]